MNFIQFLIRSFCIVQIGAKQRLTILTLLFAFSSLLSFAQPVRPKKILDDGQSIGTEGLNNGSVNQQMQGAPNPIQNANSQPRRDTIGFQHRDDAADSIRIFYRVLGKSGKFYLDSSIQDFDRYFSVPSRWIYLGNNGAAARPILFSPAQYIGFDPGYHAFDVYRWNWDSTRYYQTTKPFTSLSYQLASGKEQMLKAQHTQNVRPNLNLNFDFRLITAPGLFVTQNTNHRNLRLTGSYQSKNKRYQLYGAWIKNQLRASQNGGVQRAEDLQDPNRVDRFTVPVSLGNQASFRSNPFVTAINTGSELNERQFFIQQHYDWGKRDSIAINDSTKEYLFYPKFRIQHRFIDHKIGYSFGDVFADSLTYAQWYGLNLGKSKDTLQWNENWSIKENEFSLIQFPDAKNTAQYLQAGLQHHYIERTNESSPLFLNNLTLFGGYKNRTRNKKWDLNLQAHALVLGAQQGDYKATASISRFISSQWGNLSLHFSNVNRTPSFIMNSLSRFSFGRYPSFNKENSTSLGMELSNGETQIGLTTHTLFNYTYFSSYQKPEQFSGTIQMVQGSFYRRFKLHKNWHLHSEFLVQAVDVASPVRVPLFYTRQRLAYEGKPFRNLLISTGLECRYYSPYKAMGYSPLPGQFTVQDTMVIRNRPDVNLYLHARIRQFAGYFRVENIQTIDPANGFTFTRNNFSAPLYPTPGLMIRLGIQWWYVN